MEYFIGEYMGYCPDCRTIIVYHDYNHGLCKCIGKVWRKHLGLPATANKYPHDYGQTYSVDEEYLNSTRC